MGTLGVLYILSLTFLVFGAIGVILGVIPPPPRTRLNKVFFTLGLLLALAGTGLLLHVHYASAMTERRDADLEKRAGALNLFFVPPGIDHKLAWWLEIPPPERMQSANKFWPYRKVLNRCINPKYKEGDNWEVYYQTNVFPRLYQQYAVTWCPPDPMHPLPEQPPPTETGVQINGQVPENPAPDVYIVPEARPQ